MKLYLTLMFDICCWFSDINGLPKSLNIMRFKSSCLLGQWFILLLEYFSLFETYNKRLARDINDLCSCFISDGRRWDTDSQFCLSWHRSLSLDFWCLFCSWKTLRSDWSATACFLAKYLTFCFKDNLFKTHVHTACFSFDLSHYIFYAS